MESMNYQEIKIEEEDDVLGALAKSYPDTSKSTLRKWVAHNRVRFKGRAVINAKTSLKPGDTLKLYDKRKTLDQRLHIIYSDADIVAVDKPFGLLSVATYYESQATAHDILKQNKAFNRVFPVHRLDRETSGVMVFALNDRARDGLKDQFHTHSIIREYHAVVEGAPKENQGTWKHHLIEDANYKMHTSKKGVLSITHYKVGCVSKPYAYLICHLETGKKNQIRVAASLAGHPIVGDTKYGGANSPINRMGLHAHSLGFKHPITGKSLCFYSAVPQNFIRLFKEHKDFFTKMQQKDKL